ncbi:MAG: hypothetical protein V9F04_13860 [Dermatophilaceae bacterium]
MSAEGAVCGTAMFADANAAVEPMNRAAAAIGTAMRIFMSCSVTSAC